MNRQQIKKWSLLRHLNFKGYKRTASGNPLNMVKVMFPSQLTIYGNAVQDGTPSPDAPVEVQLCGDRTGNLLDYDVFDNAPEYVSNLSSIGCFAISVPNGAYTMSTNIEIKNNLNAGAFLIANSLPDTITSPLYGVSLNNPRTVTVSNGTLYVCIYWRNAGTVVSYPHVFTKEDFTSGTYWLMLLQGSYTADTIPPYEPYQPPQDFAVYLPEQIAKVGDVADEVVVDMEKQTAELKKNVCKYTFADNVSFTGPSANGNGEFYRYFFYSTPYMKNGIGMAGLCNVLPEYHGWNSGDFEHVHFGQNNKVIYLILNEEYSNDQDVVSHLSKKAEPYFIYPLATPVTTDITSLQQWDAMPNIRGTVSITFDSTIPISSAETEYYSKEYDAT